MRHVSRKSPSHDLPPEPAGRNRILRHARQHFFLHGFRSVTMDDLAAALGMSKKTLYAHFDNKAALLEAVIFEKFHDVEADLNRITSTESLDFSATLRNLLECFQKHLDEAQPAFVRDMRRETPEVFQRVESFRHEQIQRHFGKLFREGRRSGLIRKDIPGEVIIEILLGAVRAIMNPQKIGELGLTPKTAFMTIVTVVLDGVLTEKGRCQS